MISKTTHQQQEEPALSFSIGKIIAMVRKGGFEPPRLSAPPPQDGVSASSTTSANQGSVDYSKGVSVLYDGREGFWVEAGAAHQCAIDLFFGHQRLNVFRFYRAAVQDAETIGKILTEGLRGLPSN